MLPMLTLGPMKTLASVGAEYLCSIFWAIAVVADGVGVTGPFVGGVVEEETTQDRFFLRSASRFLVKFIGKLKPV